MGRPQATTPAHLSYAASILAPYLSPKPHVQGRRLCFVLRLPKEATLPSSNPSQGGFSFGPVLCRPAFPYNTSLLCKRGRQVSHLSQAPSARWTRFCYI